MSWFRSSAPVTQNPQTDPSLDSQGNYKPLKRDERKQCWEARDGYFACLDKNDILDAIKDGDRAASKCANQSAVFERDCAASWVKYFKQKRVADFDRAQRIKKLEAEGAVPLSQADDKPWWKVW